MSCLVGDKLSGHVDRVEPKMSCLVGDKLSGHVDRVEHGDELSCG